MLEHSTALVSCFPNKLEKKKVYRIPIIGLTTVSIIHSKGLNKLIRIAPKRIHKRMIEAYCAAKPEIIVFKKYWKKKKAAAAATKDISLAKMRNITDLPRHKIQSDILIIKHRKVSEIISMHIVDTSPLLNGIKISMSFLKKANGRSEAKDSR